MKIIFTSIVGLLLFLNGFSQSFNNDNEAIAFMNSHRATYSFEGIYEIYIRFGFFSVLAQQRAGGNDETRNEEMVKQKFESKGKKVCIYYSNNHFYLRPIGGINEKLYYENALNESLYTIDNFGIITFQQISKAEDNITNKEIRETVKVEQSDNGLFLDLFYGPKEIKLTTGERDIWSYRAHVLFKKIYAPNKTPNVGSTSFGSGFLISNKGYVVTNYHVIEGGKNIYIHLKDDKIKCTVIKTDKQNDLAIIKLPDYLLPILNKKLPRINFKTQETGTSIFTLGYPLINKMGEEIKLTTGVVSATSGYDGDNTTYQVSTAIQPGNSGGPLFNDKGEIVGIINSKLRGAENASYAIKASYLSILLSELDINVNETTTVYQDISKLALSEKVKLLKNNIFIIETE